jgi:hypothetical protein
MVYIKNLPRIKKFVKCLVVYDIIIIDTDGVCMEGTWKGTSPNVTNGAKIVFLDRE